MKTIALVALLFVSGMMHAQDIIKLKNGDELKVKVTRISENDIIYHKHSNLSGPEYVLDIGRVASVVYENGEEEVFQEKKNLPFEVKPNAFSCNYGDFVAGRFSFNYEHLFSDGKVGIKIPVGVSYRDPNSYYSNNSFQYYTGIDFNYYPMGQRRWTYFMGIGNRTGVVNTYDYYYPYPYYDNYGNYVYYPPTLSKKIATGFYVNNGLTVNMTQNISISGMFGLGLKDVEGGEWADFSAIGELNLSVRF